MWRHCALEEQIYISDGYYLPNMTEPCSCKCHFGGAVSCPRCKENHVKGCGCGHCR